MINRIVKLSFKPEHIKNFIQIFEESQMHIKAMPGCNGVKLLQDITNNNIFFTYSLWNTKEDLENYRNSNLFITTWAKTKILFNSKPETWSTVVLA